jgi:hypothetical protein
MPRRVSLGESFEMTLYYEVRAALRVRLGTLIVE